uniref:hypothetical protein n=1 Tax=Herbidospora sakaeratensis TaxID=564415 RepID=UPI0007866B30|nr:hypothetical protein [Herbidospora sakaeratensis]
MDDEVNTLISMSTQGASSWLSAFASGKEGVDITATNVPGYWVYQVEGRMLNGQASITRLAMVPRDPESPTPIKKDDVRRIPIGTIVTWVKGALRTEWENRFAKLAVEMNTHTTKQGRSWTAEHYLQVAWFAINAELSERPGGPRQAIADNWGVKKITASRWMAKARELGYLPDSPSQLAKKALSDLDAQLESTRILEELIFDKVLRAGLTQTSGQDHTTTAQLVLRTIMETSPEAAEIQSQIFVESLMDLSESPDRSIRDAANALLDALAGNDRSEP